MSARGLLGLDDLAAPRLAAFHLDSVGTVAEKLGRQTLPRAEGRSGLQVIVDVRLARVAAVAAQAEQLPYGDSLTRVHSHAAVLQVRHQRVLAVPVVDHHIIPRW